MSVLTLFGLTPPARFDISLTLWTQARIEESTSADGPFSELETQTLFPLDTTPRSPMTRGLTTTLATIGDWYRVVWIGGDGSESAPTEPVQFADLSSVAALGTLDELKGILKITNTGSDDALNRVLLAATGEVLREIGEPAFASLTGWRLALATEVAMQRAGELWVQHKNPVGFVGLGTEEKGVPLISVSTQWERHAEKLAKIKDEWGIA